ncbi:hypothetical protein HYX19_04930, partial [Candidatus Woesearchaeota archaeon]|nr:hypothetical protein [Candidatus Woesearchaeota archaeon]
MHKIESFILIWQENSLRELGDELPRKQDLHINHGKPQEARKIAPTRVTRQRHAQICRQTYNHLLSEISMGFNKNELSNYLLDLKICYPEMKQVYSKVLQVENDRLFANLSGLSVSKKNGNKVGRLRYKGKGWKKTFVYNQSGFKILKGNKKSNMLHLSKIGDIKIILHRKLEGNIKQIIIKKEINNWYAIIQTD